MLSAIHVVANIMLNSVRTGRNRRYPDFLSQRRNQCWAAISIVVIVVLATLGFAHLINNGVKNKTTYSGDMLLRVFPKSEKDKKFLHNFDSLNIDAQVWGLPVNKNVPVYIYAKAGSMHRVMKTLHGRNLSFNVLIQNMQKLIDREESAIAERRSKQSSELFDFENFHPYETIVTWLETLANTSSLINLSSMGKSYEENDLLLVTISTNNSKTEDSSDSDQHQTLEHEQVSESFEKLNSLQKRSIRPTPMDKSQRYKDVIYINCGMHAREWIAISSCLWMINELVTSKKGSVTSLLLDTYDFWIVPVANPDGYIFSWTTDRLWRKNRSPGNPCNGVDLNRNFDVRFNATSRNPCSISYGGLEPESEEETKALAKLLYLNSYRIKAALFIHSFSQLWLSPSGVNSTYPKEYPEMSRVMSKAVDAVKSFFGTDFHFGSITNALYSVPGTAIDYCYEKFGIVNSFVVELRDRGTNSFILPLDEIKPTAIETWGGVIAMALAINEQMPQTNTGKHAQK